MLIVLLVVVLLPLSLYGIREQRLTMRALGVTDREILRFMIVSYAAVILMTGIVISIHNLL